MGDGGMRYYLDCDTSPPTTSRSQVFSEKFYGYVIKYRGKEPYFEAASDEEAA
jgi:hypothetical protein